jgi:dTDP-4-amino-4,6-dideoxygalactose transaminase
MLQGLNGVRIISPPEKSRFNYFKYILILDDFDREKTHNSLEKNGISPSGYVYELPLHKQPVFPAHNQIDLPNTEFLCSKHICLPIYPALEIKDAEYIAETLSKVLN